MLNQLYPFAISLLIGLFIGIERERSHPAGSQAMGVRTFILIALMWLFIALFGVSFFFVNFGPNTTTFLIPAEIYPTNIRARAHGISAAVGKLGAFVGAFFLPFLLHHVDVFGAMGVMGVVSLLGVFITMLLPEMKNKSLDDITHH